MFTYEYAPAPPERIGENSDKIKWIVSDIHEFIPENSFDFWHDRAVFHFLTSKKNISNYAKMVSDYATNFVVGTFSTDGPTKCSGLDICQYDEMSITKTFETSNFKKVESKRVDHKTPFGTIQNFIFAGIEWKPLNNVQISKNKLEATTVFLETLEDNDDVQSVYTNLKFINN